MLYISSRENKSIQRRLDSWRYNSPKRPSEDNIQKKAASHSEVQDNTRTQWGKRGWGKDNRKCIRRGGGRTGKCDGGWKHRRCGRRHLRRSRSFLDGGGARSGEDGPCAATWRGCGDPRTPGRSASAPSWQAKGEQRAKRNRLFGVFFLKKKLAVSPEHSVEQARPWRTATQKVTLSRLGFFLFFFFFFLLYLLTVINRNQAATYLWICFWEIIRSCHCRQSFVIRIKFCVYCNFIYLFYIFFPYTQLCHGLTGHYICLMSFIDVKAHIASKRTSAIAICHWWVVAGVQYFN